MSRSADPGPDGGDHGPLDAGAPTNLAVVTVLKAAPDEGRGHHRRNGVPLALKDSALLHVGSKLEVGNSRRSVDGTRRYELSSRSKSPKNRDAIDG